MGAIVGPQEAADGLRFCEFGRADRVCCVARPTGPSNAQGAPLVGLGPKPRGGGSSSTASGAELPSPPPPPPPPPPFRRVADGLRLGPFSGVARGRVQARLCFLFGRIMVMFGAFAACCGWRGQWGRSWAFSRVLVPLALDSLAGFRQCLTHACQM